MVGSVLGGGVEVGFEETAPRLGGGVNGEDGGRDDDDDDDGGDGDDDDDDGDNDTMSVVLILMTLMRLVATFDGDCCCYCFCCAWRVEETYVAAGETTRAELALFTTWYNHLYAMCWHKPRYYCTC